MQVHVLQAHGDNYITLIQHDDRVVVIDPSTASPVMDLLQKHAWSLSHILITHDHADHTGGAASLRQETNCTIVGPTPLADRRPRDGDVIETAGMTFHTLAVPGHTQSDVAYHEPTDGLLFTGDTLFVAGCGRLFGGNATTMWNSLIRLRALPDETRVYCGHNYSIDNLEFALSLEPQRTELTKRLAAVLTLQRTTGATIPSTIAQEKATNPFLRCDDEAFQAAVGLSGRPAAEVFAAIRSRKNRW